MGGLLESGDLELLVDHWTQGGVAGTTEILESEVGVGGPSEIVGDSEVMEIYVGG